MRVLAGEDDQFDGNLQMAAGIRVSHLKQEPPLTDGATVDENIRPALQRVQNMLEEFEQVQPRGPNQNNTMCAQP